jgi:hypothetical protein
MRSSQAEPRTPPRRRLVLDAQGRAVPLSDAQLDDLAQSADALREALDSIPDDPPGSDQEFTRAIDSQRPERPLFEGYY